MPEDTELKCGFRFNFLRKCPELVFNTHSSAIIRGAIVYGDKIFEKENISYFVP
jgi:Ciliary BBSome complex subunit 2, C-terminal